jgi:hypothetical protein
MTDLNPSFSISDFEDYGTTNLYLTAEQLNSVALTESRVNDQLDWLAQLLGWSGPEYWANLASTVTQKRNLLTGSFGVYDGYIHPEVVEVRNWNGTVIIKADPRIQVGQTFYLGDFSYLLADVSQDGTNYVLTFEGLGEQFFTDLSENKQLKVIAPGALPSPFFRPEPGSTADASFLCEVQGSDLVLFPKYNTARTIPYKFNTFLAGARYFFSLPVTFTTSSVSINPTYDFSREGWYLDIPSDLSSNGFGLEGELTYESSTLRVRVSPWSNPSDWTTREKIDNFYGVWSNKGGRLPFNFVFDALGIHGFNERVSVHTSDVDKYISFYDVLAYIESASEGPIPDFGDFGAAVIYCGGARVFEGVSHVSDNFQFWYEIDTPSQTFRFVYTGSVGEPVISISDSLASSFNCKISDLVLSGRTHYMSPNVEDSGTLLRPWKSEALQVISSPSELELLRSPNSLRADTNHGPSDPNWERYFVRLPPEYGRNDSAWQKVNLVCKNFGYWGSSLNPEKMSCPPEQSEPLVYEQVVLYGGEKGLLPFLYSEPYLFSDILYGQGTSDDYDNSDIAPGFDTPYDDFDEAELVSYDLLHSRTANTSLPGETYGDWDGEYLRSPSSENLRGFLVNDLKEETLEVVPAPVWDASIYKYPPTCKDDGASSTVDANHYKVGYSLFAADLSASEEGVFDFET